MSSENTALEATRTEPSVLDSLKRSVVWNYGGTFFFYFFGWQLVFTFMGLWLKAEGMNSTNIGLVSTVMALVAMGLQPVYGYTQDRLGFRKPLYSFVVVCAALMGPFFQFVFKPLIGVDETLAAVVGGVYLSLVLMSGVSVVEAFNERASRANGFEYGHARLFGSLGGATASLVGGVIYAGNPDNVWWAASLAALVLGVLLFLAKVPHQAPEGHRSEADASAHKVSKATILRLLKDRSFLGFVVLMFGTAALYDVFDQQYAIYFSEHVLHGDPETLFSRVVFIQILCEAVVMVFTPWIVNRIGAKRGLQIFAGILVLRVLGSAFVTTTEALIAWRLLAAIEMPFMLVSVMKYITRMFDVKISATAYTLGFGFAKALGVAVFSLTFGYAYDTIGFSSAYVVMAISIALITGVASLLMGDDKGREAPTGELADGADDEEAAPVGV
ncbi:oligosaccharide MFS transporter [Demequina capsici]|uniref:Oligosaccharide MFS transporter n=1 Tax=Demequina capsici TaxID=3075620 RepID=A0AA96J8P9_9MICO|nr:oligosaccharide MFS transporter [Demequina sp. OYTSA14]WNM25620.1 oligosaccharide MFS transporter [Demequina sp. OYTSA14]